MKVSWKKAIVTILMPVMLVSAFSGCSNKNAVVTSESHNAETQSEPEAEPEPEPEPEAEPEMEAEPEDEIAKGPKEVIVYFANWNLENKKGMEGGEVASIPWEQVTYINHAFWAVAPNDGTEESSFERREKNEAPRTQFSIVSTSPEMDYMDQTPSEADPSMVRNHFAEYEVFSQNYPDVNIMISIGGWTRSGYFSEMAYTKEGRESFIKSCLDLMNQYSWIDGIDIDWEYPAGSKDGERKPEDDHDEGCPIWGTAPEDNANYTLLLKELKEAMDETYGKGTKKLTACASGSYGWTLPCQDWASAEPYLDLINVMTYDFAGTWAGITGHSSSMADAKNAIAFFGVRKIPYDKLCIGSPMYAMHLKMVEINPRFIIGASIERERPYPPEVTQTMVNEFKQQAVSGYTVKEEDGKIIMDSEFSSDETGWHFVYDEKQGAPYMYNDDEDSEYYCWFISYEDELSLQSKLDFINEKGLAGMIVWESSQDTADHQFITQMGKNLLNKQ